MFKAHLEFSLIRYANCAVVVVVVIIVVTCYSTVNCCFGCVVVYIATSVDDLCMYVCQLSITSSDHFNKAIYLFSPRLTRSID